MFDFLICGFDKSQNQNQLLVKKFAERIPELNSKQ